MNVDFGIAGDGSALLASSGWSSSGLSSGENPWGQVDGLRAAAQGRPSSPDIDAVQGRVTGSPCEPLRSRTDLRADPVGAAPFRLREDYESSGLELS